MAKIAVITMGVLIILYWIPPLKTAYDTAYATLVAPLGLTGFMLAFTKSFCFFLLCALVVGIMYGIFHRGKPTGGGE